MINLVLNKNCENKKKLIYSFYYLTRNLKIEALVSLEPKENCINVFYGVEPKGSKCIFIPEEEVDIKTRAFFNKYNNDIVVSFGKSLKEPYRADNKKVIFNYDILMTSFMLLSCKEEYSSTEEDYLNRFLAAYSFRKDYIDVPLFDVNAFILCESIRVLDNDIKNFSNNFQIMLTHDVDNVNSQTKNVFLHNAKELLLNSAKPLKDRTNQLLRQFITNRYCQFENCMNLELKYNAKSEFYFLQGRKGRLGKRYELEQIKKHRYLFEKHPQFVAGLHTNVYSYDNEDNIREEISLIEKFFDTKIESCRNHYLRFKVPETWKLLQKCGIKFDTTLGYSDANGFRAATSQSFIPYDINNDTIIQIYETPLIIMDVVSLENSDKYLNNLSKAKKLIDSVEKYNGTASILWHQCLLEDPEYKEMYEAVLQYIVSKKGIFVTKNDLNKYRDNDIYSLKQLNDMLN